MMRDTKYTIFKYISFAVFFFLMLDIFIQYQLYQRYRNDQLLNVYHQASALRARIEKEVNSNLLLVKGLADYVSFHPELNRMDLDSYCEGMLFRSKLIRSIAIAPDYVVSYVFPLKGNESFIGLDYRLSPEQWSLAKRVHDTGKLVVAGPVDLIQGGKGLIGRAPVYVRSNEYFWGIASAVIDVDMLLEKAGLNQITTLDIAIRGKDGKGADGAVFYGSQELFVADNEAVTMQVSLSSGSWEIAAIPVGGWGIIPPDSFFLHGIMFLLIISISFSIYKIVNNNVEVDTIRSNLSEAQSIARLGNWSMDLISGEIWWSDETYRIFGIKKEGYKPSRKKFFDLVYPADSKIVSDAYVEAMETGESYALDHRIIRPDGRVRYVSEQGRFAYDEEGNPVRSFGTVHDITDRKMMEEELRESKIRFDHVTNKLSHQFIFFSHTIDGEFIRLSEGFAHLGHGSPDVGIGRKWTDLFEFSPEALAYAAEKNDLVISGEVESIEYEMEFKTPDGQERCMSIYAYLARDFERDEDVFEGVALDISERKAREERLKILTRAIENAPVSVVITDTDGVITYVNPYFCKETGYSKQEAVGNNPSVLKSGEHDVQFYKGMWDTLIKGETWRGEIINKKKDGSYYWESASISPVYNPKGEVVSYVAVKEDISDQKELEQLKSDVDLIMRHDLKTPLNGIIGLPALLRMDENLNEQQHELLKTIENSGKNMLHMIDMSLDMFKMETGKYEYYPLQIDVVGIARQVIDNSRSKISAQKVRVDLLVDGQHDFAEKLLLWGEERLIYSLLSGVVANAIEASPAGEMVVVDFSQGENTVVSVSNKGVVPKPIRERFFHKYVTHGKDNGTGLGTYSAKLMADAMFYGIEMQTSDELHETKIVITIPHERPDRQDGL
ncbi:PAS domain S-box protein [Maridesulfovibrio sp.]|uniref:PAS domain S-box protein n=1 Tax=unclassified Maridesulfovibrio TaxID=2794999 RepID=UPI003AFF7015